MMEEIVERFRAPGMPGRALSVLSSLGAVLKPSALRALEAELEESLGAVPSVLNEYGYDRFGMHPASAKTALLPSAWLYRHYFRVSVDGAGRLPRGRVLLAANHAGQLPFDAAMLAMALLLDARPPRLLRGMGEYWMARLPFISALAGRLGNMVGTPENCTALLEDGECVAVFPEGVRGLNKPYRRRYQLQRFGAGFVRLALETRTPIVPVGIVGSEEQQPGLANWEQAARRLGLPAFPITLGFPWLGPLGLLPLPVKYWIGFGEAINFGATAGDLPERAVAEKVEQVRAAVSAQLGRGLAQRRGVFTG